MKNKKPSHRQERILLLLCTGLQLLLFYQLYTNLQSLLSNAEKNYASGKTINLNKGFSADSLLKIISEGNYYNDEKDIRLIADSLPRKLVSAGLLDNLGAINKQSFMINAPVSWQSDIGGAEFKNRLLASRERLGFDSVHYVKELNNPAPYSSSVKAGNGSLQIAGKVEIAGADASSVLMQLRMHIPEAENDSIRDVEEVYARTDDKGNFVFTGLEKDSGYSVIPLKPGYEFGARRGSAALSKSASFTFKGKPHQIRLIGPVVYGQLKEDKVFTVRTPSQFKSLFWMVFSSFILAFWIVHFVWMKRKFFADPFLLPVIMLLSGFSVLVLLTIQDPLQDTFHAGQMLQGVIAGLFIFTILSQQNFGKIYTKWWFDWLYNFRQRANYHLKGWTWLTLALLLALLTLVAGTGPEGSGVKVNLQLAGISFQPSEITKYLLLVFFAGFFAANEEKIRNFSDIRWRFISSVGVMAGAGALLLLYLLMGDMGPALIVCLTFLFFYSIARGNLLITLSSGILYAVLLFLLPDWQATIISFVVAAILMFWKGNIKSAKWYGWLAAFVEAPVILLLVIVAFTFGDKLPGVGERLADRKNIWLHKWNNDVYGGDQIAHGYWTLSSGGFSGQGWGKGFPNTMPAAHTDMILASIGEETGWLGLAAICILFFILIHRIFLHARRAGQSFSFYLCAGIGIATGIQFLLIAFGSIGLLPLTGVAVPFLSYGKISLIANLSAMGIVAGISARPGIEIQKEHIRTYYDPVLTTGISSFMFGLLILCGSLFFIQIVKGKEYIVKASRVVNRNGILVYSYNPRIEKLTRLLGAGTIYDRNHLVLATSDISMIKKGMDSLASAGIDKEHLVEIMNKRLRRYYPFEEHMFFWTGDFNTRLFWGQSNGYFAEAAHLGELRGFDTKPENQNYIATSYRADKFTKPVQKNVTLTSYDYTPLAAALRQGLDSSASEIKKFTDRNRDIRLSVDAALQTEIQKKLAVSKFKDKRISVVVLDAGTGDVLASAVNPLPDIKFPELMLEPERILQKLKTPVTERDLGITYPSAPGSAAKIVTAMAAFNKIGPAADTITYRDITHDEIFRKGGAEEEPYTTPAEPFVNMKLAIIRSSNVFFIRIANEYSLDDELANLYFATGIKVKLEGGNNYKPALTDQQKAAILKDWQTSVFPVRRSLYNNKAFYGKQKRYRSEFSYLAWGQGKLTATPVAMARMAGAIANKGLLQPSRYVLETGGLATAKEQAISIAKDSLYADKLKDFMIAQSNVPGKEKIKDKEVKVAGKTGTPSRTVNGKDQFDGWYVFFTPTPDKQSYTVVCIRIELGQASSNAVALANEIVPVLKSRGYLGSF